MVSQCMENNRTDHLACSCSRMHEGTDSVRYGDTSSVRIRAQRRSVTKTQSNLVCLGFSKPHSEEGRKALIVFLVVIEGVLETLVGSSRTLIEPNRSYRRLTRPNSFGIRSGVLEDSIGPNRDKYVRARSTRPLWKTSHDDLWRR